jgi:mannose-6-phosphate isomerase
MEDFGNVDNIVRGEPKHVEKSWGWELWFANTARYCGKCLFVRWKEWSSKGAYHYHKIKDETFFVVSGTLKLEYVTLDGEFKSMLLRENEAFRVDSQMKHRFTAATPEGCKFIEASTTHRDSDSYRVNWNEESQKWIPVEQ